MTDPKFARVVLDLLVRYEDAERVAQEISDLAASLACVHNYGAFIEEASDLDLLMAKEVLNETVTT